MFRVAPSFSIEKDTKALLGKKQHSLEGEVCMPAPPSRVTRQVHPLLRAQGLLVEKRDNAISHPRELILTKIIKDLLIM